MSNLTANFPAQENLVLPLAQNGLGASIRVSSLSSSVLGTLTSSDTSATWGINLNPSWVTLTVNPTNPLQVTLSYTNAQVQAAPYQFYVECVGASATVYYPISLEVSEPLSIAAANGLTEFTIPSYDSTVADIILQGIGLNGTIDTGVSFIQPTNLPPGLNVITSDESSLILRVQDPTSTNIAGGITLNTGSPESTQITIQAYKPGTMYDTPERCCTQVFTIESLTQKLGTVDVGLALNYNTTNNTFRADAYVDFLEGVPSAVTYEWDISTTGSGTISSGGGSTDKFVIWACSASGTVSFTFKVKQAGIVIATKTVSGVAASSQSVWTTTNAIKLSVSGPVETGYAGYSPSFTVSTPASEFSVDEVITVNMSVSAASGIESNATLSTSTLTLTSSSNTGTASLTLPQSGFNEKWNVSITAANSSESPTRTGAAQIVIESNGVQPITISAVGGPTYAAVTGVAIVPIAVTTGGAAATLALQGAPDGLYVSGSTVMGTLLTPGTYSFNIVASAAGYARTTSTAITLNVTQAIAPLALSALTPSTTSLPDGQPFTVHWSITGAANDLLLYQNYSKEDVSGVTQATLTEIGNSVIALVGTSYYGNAYTVPVIMLSSSITSQGSLLNAPTQAVIDENLNLSIHWQPPTVDGDYSIYKGWNIQLTSTPGGTPKLLLTAAGNLPTGLEPTGSTLDSRSYSTTVGTGDYLLDMQALSANYNEAQDASYWDNEHEFPTSITAASVTLDNTTLDLNQVLNITLDPVYVGANAWQVVFSDNTTSGWLPLSIKTVSKLFTTPGVQTIVVQTRNSFPTANPPVNLMRQVTLTVFVANQQYVAPNSTVGTTGAEGFGGEAGFEITDNYNGTSSTTQPYMVVTRTLVRDTVTNELKLLIATSRTADASSIYGTMALDVFPLAGRPKTQDIVQIPDVLLTGGVASTVPVSIATTTLPNFTVGKANSDFDLSTVANTGTAPFSWYTDGLPSGLILSISGTLSGTPQELFSGSVNFSVVDSSNPPFIADITLPISVISDLTLITTVIPGAVVGTPYSFALQYTGGIAPLTWSIVSGNLPMGLSIDPNTGIISGIPVTYNSTTDFTKTYTATIQVVDSIGAIASVVISTTLSPAALQFGNLDQPNIFASADYRMVVPVFGGASPYTLTAFSDDGVVGSGLAVANPTQIHLVAGIASTEISISTGDQSFFPTNYPAGIEVNLSAINGVAPYRFLVSTSSNNTLPNMAVYGDTLVGFPTSDGVYTANIECVDSVGHSTTKTIQISTQQENVGVYTISPVTVAFNGSTNPANWTVTKIAALPDAGAGVAYSPAAGSYYGLALYQNNVLHMTQNSGNIEPMSFALRSGSFPTNITAASANGYGYSTDYSGIVLFNALGGSFPSTLGSSSFECEFSNIQTTNGLVTQTAARESITVVPTAGSTTTVVKLVTVPEITLNLPSVSGSAYGWYLPLAAKGGVGPYTFSIQSASNLNNATISSMNGVQVLTANNMVLGAYSVILIATDSNGVHSAPTTITVNVQQTVSEPVHIVGSNLPAYVYANQPVPPNTYYVEADSIATWTATGLPSGLSISSVSGTKGYIQGTPTATGTLTYTVTATSVLYGTSASQSYSILVKPQSASIINKPTTATVGVQYSVVNNNAILTVQYVGYQPGGSSLPTLTSITGTVGTPGTLQNGLPTTQIRSVTADGFVMDFDYTNSTAGSDTITLGSGLDSCTLIVKQPALTVTGVTTTATVSEYATNATFSAPVTVSGGLQPYTIVCTSFSDSRFSAQGAGVVISPSQFQAGNTYSCAVQVQVTDSSGQVSSVSGTLQVTIRQETYDTVTFSNVNWAVNVSSSTPFTATLEPNQQGSKPVLGHSPYQYYVDAVTIPSGLTGFVVVSPSKRVLVIQFNNTGTSATVSDLGPTLGSSGSFTVPAVSSASAPAPGNYTIPVTLRVVDANSITTSQSVDVILTIS